jgi:site-specific DNA-adenine methylase
MRYPGGKGGAGVYQTIINNIPPHDTYIETHLGGGCRFQKATARNVRSPLHSPLAGQRKGPSSQP